ncbi:MAG TPA: Ig-like domain-containing protein [Candidatus Edwardsbacteria bacterium]|nr:Ig-like domain-containing protein [Candidatus Edwardsbacteria bacterium]
MCPVLIGAQQISLTTIGSAYTQDFNTLNYTDSSTVLPNGWYLNETGTNANAYYNANTGSSTTGNTYSYGASGSSERALGGLLSGSLTPRNGACFINNTGQTITSLTIAYSGEEWRCGAVTRRDSIKFELSLDAASLASGAWTSYHNLDFISPSDTFGTGAKNGNGAAYRNALSYTIGGLSIANGATFWVRWTDANASGADDGLAVDDFSLTPIAGPTIGANPDSLNFGTVAVGDTVERSYVLTGSNLSQDIVAKSPRADLKLTLASGGGYQDSVIVAQSGGAAYDTVYAAFMPSAVGALADSLANRSGGATTKYVRVFGSGSTTPVITITGGLANFGTLLVGAMSGQQSYQVSGNNLTGNITVRVPAADSFKVSLTSGSGYGDSVVLVQSGGSVPATTVYVVFKPITPGRKAGNIAHTSPGAATQNQAVTGKGIPAAPTVQASGLAFSAVTADSMNLSWTRGDGAACIVLAKCEAAVDSAPVDGTYYAANDSFGRGAALGAANYAVYRGAGSAVRVRNLYGITMYDYAVFEYNGPDSAENYLSAAPATGSQMTASATGVISLTALGSPYTQGFNALDTVSQALPTGWNVREEGANANHRYAADDGSATAGNSYSYGRTDSTDRALGGLQSSSLLPTVSAAFVNNTGGIIPALDIAYAGEEWRLGTRSRYDTLEFELSTAPGVWTPVPALNFATKDTSGAVGARNGNAAFWRDVRWASIAGLNIANGASFRIRWTDANASGSDDGLAVDDLTLTPFAGTDIPRIIATVPADTAANVAVGAAVQIAFSERMRPASLAYACAPDPGGWSAAWNAGGDTVTLSHANFKYYTAYTFTVTAARDSDENRDLAAGRTPNPFTFTTAIDPTAPPMSITCLDVGQANCTIIRSPTGKRVMIDCYSHKVTGSQHNAQDSLRISNFIKDSLGAANTPYLDDLFLTHWDHDHAGYIDVVVRHLDSLNGNAYDRGPLDTTDTDFLAYKNSLTARGWWGKRVIGSVGAKQTIDIGNGASIQVVCVRGKTILGDSLTTAINENNMCLGLLIKYGSFKMCQTGDIESQMENLLAGDFDSVNVMVVNHHGSAYSSTQNWVNALNPQVSIISVGDSNSYGHPDSGATRRLTSDPGLNNYIYLTERGDTTKPLPVRSSVRNRNIHITVDLSNHKYTVDGDQMPLGVTMADFAAAAGAGGVTLRWSTESETDCYRWDIERSAQQQGGYAAVGSVPGHGTTAQPQRYAYLDTPPGAAAVYWYRLAQVDLSGRVTYHGPLRVVYNARGIAGFQAGPVHPNPASGQAGISYQLPLPGRVTLGVYNVLGQRVRGLVDARQPADRYTATWDGRDGNGRRVSGGVYFYRLTYEDDLNAAELQATVKKMVLMR